MLKDRILLIDDDKITRNEFVYIFQNSKYFLDTAKNSIEGQSEILETEFDLVLLDIRMPDLSNRFSETAGLELLDWIKREKPLLAVIMLSAINEVKIAVKAMKSSAKDYITKDNFKTEELFSMIDDILLSDVIFIDKKR